ncbi:MAG: hypothetical protein ABEK17_04540 [Candidatus Aenigmatarchaeota archaeon]
MKIKRKNKGRLVGFIDAVIMGGAAVFTIKQGIPNWYSGVLSYLAADGISDMITGKHHSLLIKTSELGSRALDRITNYDMFEDYADWAREEYIRMEENSGKIDEIKIPLEEKSKKLYYSLCDKFEDMRKY